MLKNGSIPERLTPLWIYMYAKKGQYFMAGIYGADLGPRDCTDIRAMGYNVSGIYRVYPGSDTRRIETDVYCDFSSWTESWLVRNNQIPVILPQPCSTYLVGRGGT